ncbi:hypothetical protein ACFOLF_09345 [Paenibacillus sepulcri]|uniref:DUF4064 domain-containing protein n=1 Tax=Paenibacillus sepulcri TaxID=359917 RepID=A0ABS7C8G6_9BACL|nr:hypothetical protein [Paenibacillus sepulcri]
MNDNEEQSYHLKDTFNPEPAFEPEPVRSQSKLGIASFIIGLASIVGFIICSIIAASSIMDYITADGKTVQNIEKFSEEIAKDAPLLLSILFMIVSIGLSLIGLILGIVGACMRNTRKAFSIIGIVLNGLLSFGFAALFAAALITQMSA